MDMNAVFTGVAGVVTGLGGALAWGKRFEKKFLPFVDRIEKAVEVLSIIPEAKKMVENTKEAIQADNTAERAA